MGACRRANRLDGGRVDRVLTRYGGAFRADSVFHARQSLGRVGEHGVGFDDLEENLGLSRTYQIELADIERTLDAIQALRELEAVEAVAVETLASAPLEYAAPWAVPMAAGRGGPGLAREPHERIHAAQALEMEPGDEGVTVAVVDTGVSLGHPEVQTCCKAGYSTVDLGMGRVAADIMLVGDSRGPDFNCIDRVGHGSHVAGVIGARGYHLPRGVAGQALILPLRVLAAAVSQGRRKLMGLGALPNIDAGLKVAVDLGAAVINMSFGTAEADLDPGAPRPHASIIRYAHNYGCVLISAAGNSGKLERYYPAALPEVIAVGSVDRAGHRSHFSTYGPHLAICAPGEDIVSIGIRGYRVSSGTSHAAPFVSGVAALLVSRARRAGRRLNGDEVRRLLVESAAPLGPGGYSSETGYGLLDAAAALRALDRALDSTHMRAPPGQPKEADGP